MGPRPLSTVVSGGAGLDGDQGLDILAASFPQSQQIACAATDRYTYVWKTEKSWKGSCRRLTVRLDDGSTHVLPFQFR